MQVRKVRKAVIKVECEVPEEHATAECLVDLHRGVKRGTQDFLDKQDVALSAYVASSEWAPTKRRVLLRGLATITMLGAGAVALHYGAVPHETVVRNAWLYYSGLVVWSFGFGALMLERR